MFIVVEGLDGTGKSTTAKALADALQGVFLNTPLDKFRPVRSELEDIYGEESLARQLFYASTAVCSSNRITESLKENKHVIIDRYWYSTQVYHSWRTGSKHLALKEVEDLLVKPDMTVYLSLPLQARKTRVDARYGNTDEDFQTMTIESDAVLNALYRSYSEYPFSKKWLELDASQPTKQIIAELLKVLDIT